MSFDLDPSKQVRGVICSKITIRSIHSKIFSNNIPVSKANTQKHVEVYSDSILSFKIYIRTILTKVNKNISSLQKVQQILSRSPLNNHLQGFTEIMAMFSLIKLLINQILIHQSKKVLYLTWNESHLKAYFETLMTLLQN